MTIIRKIKKQDIKQIESIYRNVSEFKCLDTDDFWANDELSAWVLNANDVCICAVTESGVIIGYALTHIHIEVNKVHIENIFVEKEQRGKKIGKKLLQWIVQEYNNKFPKREMRYVAMVNENNKEALSYFKTQGFQNGEKMIWAQKYQK
jgi:L-amino acid N-acyltransferase YncA